MSEDEEYIPKRRRDPFARGMIAVCIAAALVAAIAFYFGSNVPKRNGFIGRIRIEMQELLTRTSTPTTTDIMAAYPGNEVVAVQSDSPPPNPFAAILLWPSQPGRIGVINIDSGHKTLITAEGPEYETTDWPTEPASTVWVGWK